MYVWSEFGGGGSLAASVHPKLISKQQWKTKEKNNLINGPCLGVVSGLMWRRRAGCCHDLGFCRLLWVFVLLWLEKVFSPLNSVAQHSFELMTLLLLNVETICGATTSGQDM